MTSDPVGTDRAYVWVWLPGASDPVVAGVLARSGRALDRYEVLPFAYARSYLDRPDAISLFTPELPLRRGTFDPTSPVRDTGWRGVAPTGRSATHMAGCLRDAVPDAWGRRVLNLSLAGNPDADLGELTYLLHSASNRTGAIDFQESATGYAPRGETATLDQLAEAADLTEHGKPIPDELAAAAGHGTSIGGARPKARLEDTGRQLIAKFSSTTDDRPVVKAEAAATLLAARVGINVPDVQVVRAAGKDVLLIERFDRASDHKRRSMVSALTILGLRETESRYASYADIAASIKNPGWRRAGQTLQEMFRRLVFNVCIGNNDDHLRNHAAFWDGRELELTPAFDLCPQRRTTAVSAQAIGITRDGRRHSQLWVCRDVAPEFNLTTREADEIITDIVDTVRSSWHDVCEQAMLTTAERAVLFGREILNDYIFWDSP